MTTSIEVQLRPGVYWLPGELNTESSDGAPVVVVAGPSKPLGPEDAFYIGVDEDNDVFDEVKQAGFPGLQGA